MVSFILNRARLLQVTHRQYFYLWCYIRRSYSWCTRNNIDRVQATWLVFCLNFIWMDLYSILFAVEFRIDL